MLFQSTASPLRPGAERATGAAADCGKRRNPAIASSWRVDMDCDRDTLGLCAANGCWLATLIRPPVSAPFWASTTDAALNNAERQPQKGSYTARLFDDLFASAAQEEPLNSQGPPTALKPFGGKRRSLQPISHWSCRVRGLNEIVTELDRRSKTITRRGGDAKEGRA